MKTKVYIISGFLGAGKTTLIQKLLEEYFTGSKTVLIENDFGEISVDASLLRGGGFEVKEMNSGCICCSLSGDFIKSMKDIVRELSPEYILIEPSGVGKLSDVANACTDPQIHDILELRTKVTVVDVKRCKKYMDNFGEFFEDQIVHADKIVLSRVEECPEKINDTKAILRGINTKTVVYSKPFSELDSREILSGKEPLNGLLCPICGEHQHDEHCGCEHNHKAEEIFDTFTLHPQQQYTREDLENRLNQLNDSSLGQVLRVKGMIKTQEGFVNVQFLPGDISMTACHDQDPVLCIIGKNLMEDNIRAIFHESLS